VTTDVVDRGRILVVDDEATMRRTLQINLQARGFDVDLADSGEEALAAASSTAPDVVLLDLGLPGISGLDVIHSLRTWSTVPIIVVSARDTEGSKVLALDAGADDYVSKPFGMEELLARLRAALRRAIGEPEPPLVVETPTFALDIADRRVVVEGTEVRLTPTEWRLLEVLVRHHGRLVTQGDLLAEVWGPGYEAQSNYLRVYVGTLRRKLEPVPSQPRHLRTEPGIGYRFVV
jgi:two-component system, OmpR family, KDP operon response regulator KdpE